MGLADDARRAVERQEEKQRRTREKQNRKAKRVAEPRMARALRKWARAMGTTISGLEISSRYSPDHIGSKIFDTYWAHARFTCDGIAFQANLSSGERAPSFMVCLAGHHNHIG